MLAFRDLGNYDRAPRRNPLLVTTHSISRRLLNSTATLFSERAELARLPANAPAAEALKSSQRDRFVRTGLALLGHASAENSRSPSPLVVALRELFAQVSSPSGRRPHVRDQLEMWQHRVIASLDESELESFPAAGFRGADFRSQWTWVEIDEALFVPPPSDQIPAQLDALDAWLREPVDGPAVALLVSGVALHTVMHLQPLSSLNDLVATCVALDHLGRADANPHGLLALDLLWSDPRRLYRAMDEGMWSGDLTRWLELYMDVVLKETQSIATEARNQVRREQAAAPPATVGLNDRQRKALEIIREQGKITNRDYRKLLGVSNKTAHQELRVMVERKVIRRQGFGRGVMYV